MNQTTLEREVTVDSAGSGHSKLPCCEEEVSGGPRGFPGTPVLQLCDPRGDHEVTHLGQFQGYRDETYLPEMPDQLTGGRDLRRGVKRCAPSSHSHSQPRKPENLIISTAPQPRRRIRSRIRIQAASGLSGR